MKRHFLVLLSTIFAIAAITLVIVQISQMNRSAKMSDNLFNISVNNAIDEVFNQLDHMKIEDYLSSKERYRMMQYRRIDEMNEKMQDIIRNNSDLFYDDSRVNFGISTKDSAYILSKARTTDEEKGAINQYNTLLNARNRLLSAKEYSSVKYRDLVANNTIDPTRLNFPLLDSLVREELIINGVDFSPFVGILLSGNDSLLFCDADADSSRLINSPFKYTFRTNGMIINEDVYLVLYFKSSPIILSSNARFYTILSICMILLITFLFILSIRTIYSQRKLDEMKTDFINNMTHEIKTPIATISLACEMLKDDTVSSDSAQMRNFVNIIGEENRRMRMLVETLLQSAKMASKRFTIAPKEIDLNHVVENAVQSFHLAIKNKNGVIETDLQPLSGVLFADELHITNTVHNLIDNAIKYSTDELYVKVSTRMEGNNVVLKIQDHGIGIAKEDQKHIFEKFYRVSTGNVHNVKGFGIGLSYVSQVVALHEGHINVESELGKGCTFTITLPLS